MGRRGFITKGVFREIPIELVREIISWLPPRELATWYKVNNVFRKMLSTTPSLWHGALALVPGLPQCPPDMHPRQYAAFLFGRGCTRCKSKPFAKVRLYELRLRLCTKCCGSLEYVLPEHQDVVPSVQNAPYAGRVSPEEYALFQQQIATLDESERMAFLKDCRVRCNRVLEHAELLYEWEEDSAASLRQESEARLEEKRVIREKRMQTIVQYLIEEEGCSEQLIRLFEPKLRTIPFAIRASVISLSAWKRNRETVIGPLQAYQALFEEIQCQARVQKRKILHQMFRSFNTMWVLPRLPDLDDAEDLAWFPHIPELLDDGLILSELNLRLAGSFMQQSLRSEFDTWVTLTIEFAFLNLLPEETTSQVFSLPVEMLERGIGRSLCLATTVFKFDGGVLPTPPHFPFVSRYRSSRWTFDAAASLSIAQSLQSCGMDPSTTSWADVAVRDYRFACCTCLLDPDVPGPNVMDWWQMVHHLQKIHCDRIADCRRVSSTIEALVRSIVPYVQPALYRCSQCYIVRGAERGCYFRTPDEARHHVLSTHYFVGELFDLVLAPFDEHSVDCSDGPVALIGAEELDDFPQHLLGTKMPGPQFTKFLLLHEYMRWIPGLRLFP